MSDQRNLYRIVIDAYNSRATYEGAVFCKEVRAIDALTARRSVGTLYTDSGSYPEWEIRSCRVVPKQLGPRGQAAYDAYIAPGWEWLGRGYGYGKPWFCKTCGAFTGPATIDRYHEGHDVEKD